MTIKASTDCPICNSNCRFDLDEAKGSFNCDDCGFELVERGDQAADSSDRLDSRVICLGRWFYRKETFLNIRKSDKLVCYKCQAEYATVLEGVVIDDVFLEQTAKALENSVEHSAWLARIAAYE
jgi:Zn finger protein HypA/HybF involved in hydrogenase expression